MKKEKLLPIVLALLNVIFIVYYAFWSFNGFMHFDDLGATAAMMQSSIFEHVYDIYMNQSGRFVGCFICACIFKIVALTGLYRFWPFLFLMIGYALMGMIIKNVPIIKKGLGLLSAIFIYNLYVLTAIDFAVFTWICALYYYLLAPSLILFCIYLCKRRLTLMQWILFAFLGIFIAGGSEAFTPVALFVMFLLGMYYWHQNKWRIKYTWSQSQIKRIVYSAVIILLLFAVVVVAQGNYVRMETSTSEGFAHPEGVIGWGVALVKCVVTYLYLSAFYLPYYLVSFCLFAYLGTQSQFVLPMSKFKALSVVTVLFIVYLVVSVIPIAYVYNGFGIQRLYTHLNFVLIVYISALGYVIGMRTTLNDKLLLWLSLVGLVCLSGIMIVNIVNDVPIMKQFSKSVDDRLSYLSALQEEGNKETIVVEPYANMHAPDAKYYILKWLGRDSNNMQCLYYEADADVIPNEYEEHYRQVYGLDFDFVLAKEK